VHVKHGSGDISTYLWSRLSPTLLLIDLKITTAKVAWFAGQYFVGVAASRLIDFGLCWVEIVHISLNLVEPGADLTAVAALSAVEGFGYPAHGKDVFDVDSPPLAGSKRLAAIECHATPAVELGPEQGHIAEVFGIRGLGVGRGECPAEQKGAG